MKNLKIIAITTILMVLLNILGHDFPPLSIYFSPVFIVLISWLFLEKTDFPLIYKTLIIDLLVILNDLLIRTFVGGDIDSQGNAWIVMYMFFGFAIYNFYLLLLGLFRYKFKLTLYCILLNILIFSLYLYFFGMYGVNK